MCFRDAEGHTPGESARAIAESQLPGAPADSRFRPTAVAECGVGQRTFDEALRRSQAQCLRHDLDNVGFFFDGNREA